VTFFESSKLKAWTSLLPCFSEKRIWSSELWALKQHSKMSPQVGSAVLAVTVLKDFFRSQLQGPCSWERHHLSFTTGGNVILDMTSSPSSYLFFAHTMSKSRVRTHNMSCFSWRRDFIKPVWKERWAGTAAVDTTNTFVNPKKSTVWGWGIAFLVSESLKFAWLFPSLSLAFCGPLFEI